jgi:signal transduction histidine kinase
LEPVREANRAIAGVVLTLVDVTERRRIKDALRISEETKEEIQIDHERVAHERTRLAAVIEHVSEGTLEKQLRQAQKMESLGTLAGGIAHDLNNILMPIIMNAEMMEEDIDPSSPLGHYARKVLTSAHRGRDLVRRILDFSREKDEEKLLFPIAQSVQEALDLVRPTIPSSVKIKQHIAEDIGQIKGDPAQIQEVIVNLCTNASHAIGTEPGLIEVSLCNEVIDETRAGIGTELQTGAYVKLSVRDTGMGMDKSLMERIFEPFFTTKKPSEGTGMGLAMVHGAVKRHEGTITVTSEIGQGARFDVYFPRAEESFGTKKSTSRLQRGNGEHIFFVDDELDIVDAAFEVLSRLGYEVTSETRASYAIDLFRQKKEIFDLAILDFTLPDMTGLDLAKEMIEIRPDIPIVLASGFTGDIDNDELRSLGIKRLLNKPLSSREIGSVVRQILDNCV